MTPLAEFASPGAPLMAFALGYLAVLAAPGPNMLAVGTLAALRGFRGVLPFVLGIAAGVGGLAVAMLLAFGTMTDLHRVEGAARAIGGALLLAVALRVMRQRRPALDGARPVAPAAREDDLIAFGAGFTTALTNPVTAAYFAAQFLGPLGRAEGSAMAVPIVASQALLVGLLVALLFARPGVRRAALAHHRKVCVASGLALAALAGAMVWPLVPGG